MQASVEFPRRTAVFVHAASGSASKLINSEASEHQAKSLNQTSLFLQLMTPAAVLARTNGREAVSRGDVEEVHTLFRWAD